MTKLDLLKKMVKRSGATLTMEQAEIALNSFIAETIAATKARDNVTLIGFGTFRAYTPRPRIRRDRKTGEEEFTDPKTRVKFTPGKALKDLHAKPVKVKAVLPPQPELEPIIKEKKEILKPSGTRIFCGGGGCHHGRMRRRKKMPNTGSI